MAHLVYASSNPGKLLEVNRFLRLHGYAAETMRDLGCADLDVPEPGNTLGENAILKVRAYIEEIRKHPELHGQKFIVMSDDTGLEIDGLNGEPGIHVRRWKDGETRMGDEEVIDYTLERMRGLTGLARGAQFRTVLAGGLLHADTSITEPIFVVDGTLRGTIREEATEQRIKGFPYTSLFFIPEYDMMLGDLERLSDEEKGQKTVHRERSVERALPFLAKYMVD